MRCRQGQTPACVSHSLPAPWPWLAVCCERPTRRRREMRRRFSASAHFSLFSFSFFSDHTCTFLSKINVEEEVLTSKVRTAEVVLTHDGLVAKVDSISIENLHNMEDRNSTGSSQNFSLFSDVSPCFFYVAPRSVPNVRPETFELQIP